MDDDAQDYDNMKWDIDDQIYAQSILNLRKIATCKKLETLNSERCEHQSTMKGPVRIGGYNAVYTMTFEDPSLHDIIIRVPIFGSPQFPEEKTTGEVAVMKYLQEKTNILVPTLLHWGLSNQDPKTGPYIIMSYTNNNGSLSQALNDPLIKEGDPHILNQFISLEKLSKLYTQMARHLLELSRHHFPLIGSLQHNPNDNAYSVSARPLSVNMNQAVRLSNILASVLPPLGKTYTTANEWYVELARTHFIQLVFQQNDLIFNEDDCRNKYISRLLFYKLALTGKLSTFGFRDDTWSAQSKSGTSNKELLPVPPATGSFSLWCDDLRAGNVLLDENDQVQPERWDDGIELWTKIYDERVEVWFKGMETAEQEVGSQDNLTRYMRESWETGRFWMNYAARNSWAFDGIYWKYLDERFFGARGEVCSSGDKWKMRIGSLSTEEKNAMDRFVERKMEEGRERVLVDWEPKEATERLEEMLRGREDVGDMMESLNLC